MIRKLRSKLTYSNVVASLALFLALGGGTAIALKGTNTVDSGDIINGQVRTPDLAPDAVTPGKLGTVKYAEVEADESTQSLTPVDLATVGPSLTIQVPAQGVLKVYASVEIKVSEMGGGCAILLTSPSLAAPQAFVGGSTASTTFTTARVSGLIMPAAGARSAKLQYQKLSGTPSTTCNFKNRRLWIETVAP